MESMMFFTRIISSKVGQARQLPRLGCTDLRGDGVNASVLRILLLGALGLAVLPGCKSRADRNETSSSTTKAASARIAAVSHLSSAEAVVFDSARDVYFVSNISGDAGVKDGNGF